MTKRLLVSGLLVGLASCGVPTDPEKGPVVLLCDGEEVIRAQDGTERSKLTRFYKVDGVERSLEVWDNDDQTWMGSPTRITITPNEISRADEPRTFGDITTIRTITFDRVAGRVHEEFAMTNGGVTTFDANCKPVEGPTSEAKF